MIPAISCSSHSSCPAASAASMLSIADAASPFMNTDRSSFIWAASPASLRDDLDRHPQRAEQLREGASALPDASVGVPIPSDGPEQRDIGEAGAGAVDEGSELALESRRGGVQVGVDALAVERREHGLGRGPSASPPWSRRAPRRRP